MKMPNKKKPGTELLLYQVPTKCSTPLSTYSLRHFLKNLHQNKSVIWFPSSSRLSISVPPFLRFSLLTAFHSYVIFIIYHSFFTYSIKNICVYLYFLIMLHEYTVNGQIVLWQIFPICSILLPVTKRKGCLQHGKIHRYQRKGVQHPV